MTMKRRMASLLLLSLVAAWGCSQGGRDEAPRQPFAQQEIIIGLIPEQNIFKQRERYQLLKQYLTRKLGITVTFTSLSRYGNIVERFRSEKMDGAFFGSFTYALAHSQLGVEALVRPVNLDGTSTYHGYLFVRKSSGIRTATDMRGKRFAFVEQATTAGYLFPLAYFRQHGIVDARSYFRETFFAGSHDAAVMAVLNGEADIGAAKNTVYDQLAAENPRVERELVVLAASQTVPQNGLAVRKGLDPDLKAALKQALLEMERDEEGAEVLRQFGARGFADTTDRDYSYVYTLCSKVGIDLTTYRYENR